jgi:hypothetical protein
MFQLHLTGKFHQGVEGVHARIIEHTFYFSKQKALFR